MKINVKDITYLAIGIALFVMLSMCLRVPVFENYYLCLGYVVMTLYIWCFKWYEGAIIGFLGVILYCIVGGLGFNGMPGWSVGNIIIRLGKNMTSFIADAFVIVVSLPICSILEKTARKLRYE